MRAAAVTDASVADFAGGTTDDGAYVARTLAGEVILRPKVAGEFTGTDLPPGWSVTPIVEGGHAVVGDGMLALHGARLGCDPLLLSPRSIELAAVFAARPDQHAGFGTDFVDVPWVMFSTKWGRRLYGRTHLLNVEDKKLPGDWLCSRHVFRIDWNVLDIVFSVDGERLAQIMVPIPGYMRGLAANERLGNDPLLVEWMRVSPYALAGRFTSRVFDAGTQVEWMTTTWCADLPAGTTLAVAVRAGDTPEPGPAWSPWKTLEGPDSPVALTSQYVQYRADLGTGDASRTPVLRRVSLAYRPVSGSSGNSSGSGRATGFQ